MRRVGLQLIQEKRAAILQEKDELTSKSMAGSDILSVLVRANMATDLKESERMTDEEMMGQITTMLLAGESPASRCKGVRIDPMPLVNRT